MEPHRVVSYSALPKASPQQEPRRRASVQVWPHAPSVGLPAGWPGAVPAVVPSPLAADGRSVLARMDSTSLQDTPPYTHAAYSRPVSPTSEVYPVSRASTSEWIAPVHTSPDVSADWFLDHHPARPSIESLRPHEISARARPAPDASTRPARPARNAERVSDARIPSRAASPVGGAVESSMLSRQSSRASLAPAMTPSAIHHVRPEPGMYPALLSQVARAFVKNVVTSDLTKDGLTYANAFDGRQAVDVLATLVRTSDRNLAVLLGRALDAQKLFHDVTYSHRLRDTPNEVYHFYTHTHGAQYSDEDHEHTLDESQMFSPRSSIHTVGSRRNSAQSVGGASGFGLTPMTSTEPVLESVPTEAISQALEDTNGPASVPMPTGVFTLLTTCYSPTCTRSRPCYSIACPRHVDRHTKPSFPMAPTLVRTESHRSTLESPGELWADSVPKDVYASVPDQERQRQEVLFELIATERAFVHDLEYLRDYWITPLQTQNIVETESREELVRTLFHNLLDILAVNQRVVERLVRRQKQQWVVESVGDIYLEAIHEFEPYVAYGANQMLARLKLESEKATNPSFAAFVAETERKAESRKLELNGYLTKPTTRLARYPLLFEQVLKYTDEANPDKATLPLVTQKVQTLLGRVNDETGRCENRLQLTQISRQLVFKPGETVDLRLQDEERELVFKGSLKKRSGVQNDNADVQVFLFDHAMLMARSKLVQKADVLKVYRKPIPLELLQATVYEDVPVGKGSATRPRATTTRSSLGSRVGSVPLVGHPTSKQDAKTGFAITLAYLGKKGYTLTLWASTYAGRAKWFEHIESRQEILRERSTIFDSVALSERAHSASNRTTSAAPFNFGRQVFYGRDDGVYLADLRTGAAAPSMVVPLAGVTQLDVLEEYQILIVLAEQCVYTFTLDALDAGDPVGSLKRGRRISSHTTFFRAGICLGRTLVCVVKSGPISSTIKTLEPIESSMRAKKQPTFRKLLQGGQDTLRVFKEFYIPTESSSIHFLKSKLCIGTAKGFEIVDLETLDTQGLLDPADTSLEFVQRREGLKPIAIYRIEGEFLLCYNEFAFYVNKNGWRAKGKWLVQWEGNPTAFALHHPYLLAFEPNFIEVRHVDTGILHQVITGNHLRCIFADANNTMSSAPPRTPVLPAPTMAHSPRTHQGATGTTYTTPTSPFRATFAEGSPALPNYARPPAGPMHPIHGVARAPAAPTGTSNAGLAALPPTSAVHESVQASRNHIVFVGETSVYSLRLHT